MKSKKKKTNENTAGADEPLQCAECRVALAGRRFVSLDGERWARRRVAATEPRAAGTERRGGEQMGATTAKVDSNGNQPIGDDEPTSATITTSDTHRCLCLHCYDRLFGAACHECSKLISCDLGAISHGERRWHASGACFKCCRCSASLLECPFYPSREGDVFCSSECAHQHEFKSPVRSSPSSMRPRADAHSQHCGPAQKLDPKLANNFNLLLHKLHSAQQPPSPAHNMTMSPQSRANINTNSNHNRLFVSPHQARSLTLGSHFGRPLPSRVAANHPFTRREQTSHTSQQQSSRSTNWLNHFQAARTHLHSAILEQRKQAAADQSADPIGAPATNSTKLVTNCATTNPFLSATDAPSVRAQVNNFNQRRLASQDCVNYINLDCLFDCPHGHCNQQRPSLAAAMKPPISHQQHQQLNHCHKQQAMTITSDNNDCKCDPNNNTNQGRRASPATMSIHRGHHHLIGEQDRHAQLTTSAVVTTTPTSEVTPNPCHHSAQCSPAASVASNEGAQSDHSGTSRSSGIHSCNGAMLNGPGPMGEASSVASSQCCSSSSSSSRSSVSSGSGTISSALSLTQSIGHHQKDHQNLPLASPLKSPTADESNSNEITSDRINTLVSTATATDTSRSIQLSGVNSNSQAVSQNKPNSTLLLHNRQLSGSIAASLERRRRVQPITELSAMNLLAAQEAADEDDNETKREKEPFDKLLGHFRAAARGHSHAPPIGHAPYAAARRPQAVSSCSGSQSGKINHHAASKSESFFLELEQLLPANKRQASHVAPGRSNPSGGLVVMQQQTNCTALDTNGLPTVVEAPQAKAALDGELAPQKQLVARVITDHYSTVKRDPAKRANQQLQPANSQLHLNELDSNPQGESPSGNQLGPEQLRQSFFALTSPLLEVDPQSTCAAPDSVSHHKAPLSLYGLAESLQQAGCPPPEAGKLGPLTTAGLQTTTKPVKSVSFDPNLRCPDEDELNETMSLSQAATRSGLKSALKSGSSWRRRELELAQLQQMQQWEQEQQFHQFQLQQQQQMQLMHQNQQFLAKSSHLPAAYSAHYDEQGRRIRLSSLVMNQQLGAMLMPQLNAHQLQQLPMDEPEPANAALMDKEKQVQAKTSLGRSLWSDALAKFSLTSSSRGGRRHERQLSAKQQQQVPSQTAPVVCQQPVGQSTSSGPLEQEQATHFGSSLPFRHQAQHQLTMPMAMNIQMPLPMHQHFAGHQHNLRSRDGTEYAGSMGRHRRRSRRLSSCSSGSSSATKVARRHRRLSLAATPDDGASILAAGPEKPRSRRRHAAAHSRPHRRYRSRGRGHSHSHQLPSSSEESESEQDDSDARSDSDQRSISSHSSASSRCSSPGRSCSPTNSSRCSTCCSSSSDDDHDLDEDPYDSDSYDSYNEDSYDDDVDSYDSSCDSQSSLGTAGRPFPRYSSSDDEDSYQSSEDEDDLTTNGRRLARKAHRTRTHNSVGSSRRQHNNKLTSGTSSSSNSNQIMGSSPASGSGTASTSSKRADQRGRPAADKHHAHQRRDRRHPSSGGQRRRRSSSRRGSSRRRDRGRSHQSGRSGRSRSRTSRRANGSECSSNSNSRTGSRRSGPAHRRSTTAANHLDEPSSCDLAPSSSSSLRLINLPSPGNQLCISSPNLQVAPYHARHHSQTLACNPGLVDMNSGRSSLGGKSPSSLSLDSAKAINYQQQQTPAANDNCRVI